MYLLFILISAVSVMLIFRLFYIQIVRGPLFAEAAFLQKTGTLAEKVRGGIFDAKGKSLTGNFTASFALISPNWLSQEEKLLLQNNGIIESITSNKIANVQVTQENSNILYRLKGKTPGVVFYERDLRYGPDALATHVVGIQGQTGIEKTFNSFLETDIKKYYVINDGLGQPIGGITLRHPTAETWGVKLTIDGEIQKIVENIMDESISKGAVIVIDANSGEILAMASRPNYKQYMLEYYLNQEDAPLINRAVESYTPGSIFKIVVLAAALEEKIADLNEVFYCKGFEQVGGNIFKCSSYDEGGHGELTLQNALAYSCNSVFIQLGMRLGKDKILDYARLFGLGEKALIGLPEEKAGNIPRNRDVYYQDIGNISIGQGAIGVTPLQAAQLLLAIVNDGVLKKPVLVKEVMDSEGNSRMDLALEPKPQKILSAETAQKVRKALEAVTRYGTGMRANPRNHSNIGGKTGTAETAGNTSHAWFVGYYPAEKPKLVISVFVEHGGSGSVVAAPIFREVVEGISSLTE